MLVAAEATWVSLLLNAAINSSTSSGGPQPQLRIPFLVVALPAVSATVVTGLVRRRRWRWWWKAAALTVVVIVGAALTAGVVSDLTTSGSWWQAAVRPWSTAGHPAAVTTAAAWFVAGLTWGRGLWLGLATPSFRQTGWSLALGGLAFLSMFLGRADHRATAYLTNTRSAGWLLFVFFVLITASLALVRERDREESLLVRGGSPPAIVWMGILAVPTLGVALVALFVAAIVGPGAPAVGRAATRAAQAVARPIAAMGRGFWDLLPLTAHHGHVSTSRSAPPPGPSSHGLRIPHPPHASFTVPAVVWEVVGALLVVFLIRILLRRFGPLLRSRPPSPGNDAEEERDSIFSWRHLFAQLRTALARWPKRRRRPTTGGGGVGQARSSAPEAEMAVSVRQAYRGVLVAARTSGRPRHTSETARELDIRLSTDLATDTAEALAGLTDIYDAVRYGALQPDAAMNQVATAQAEMVRTALPPLLDRPTGTGGPAGGRR
jgi:hypothetical protein